MGEFCERLCAVMKEKGISQSKLCTVTGIPKSALSQYISGGFKPKQNRTMLLAEALEVDPAWLIGYDVPRERSEIESKDLNLREMELVQAYRSDPSLRCQIDELLDTTVLNTGTKPIYRAAKSLNGNKSAGNERINLKQLELLKDTPDTDDDL